MIFTQQIDAMNVWSPKTLANNVDITPILNHQISPNIRLNYNG